MKRTPHWILVLKVCFLVSIVALAQDDSEYISIDCGVSEGYTDSNTSISYKSDTSFISTGENHIISSDHSFPNRFFGRQLVSLRSFPDGKRNCYTLKPKQGKNNNYHITALFAYGNYDGKDEIPVFDVYLGVNYWDTIEIDDSTYHLSDVIYVATTDTIDVCLVNTDKGIPFISLLELRFLKDPIYRPESGNTNPADRYEQVNLGMFEQAGHFVRYMDDTYSRVWREDKENFSIRIPFNTSTALNTERLNDAYKLPIEVLSTAVRAFNTSSSLQIVETIDDKSYEYVVYLHFFEFEESAQKEKKRTMNIDFNGESILTEPLTLHYWHPTTIYHKIKLSDDDIDEIIISITSTLESDLPAMLSAYEIYRVLPQPNPTTARGDVDAMWDIKHTYEISRISWQGDPCIPKTLAWEGLSCSSDNNPRVTSLNLNSSNLRGDIAPSFSNLTKLEGLDLSNNELTGDLPEFLAELPNLHVLNLARNNLTGSIPKVLKEKSKATLMLSLDGNPDLCQTDSCASNQHKSAVPRGAIVAGAMAFLMIIIILSLLMIRRLRREKPEVISTTFGKDKQLKSKKWTFSYAEVLSITDNFKTVIGKGGFGYVYLGSLQDSRQVAVKLLSNLSMQGLKEFQSEAQLLMIVHHRNLVPLVGYCNEGDIRALVYEYVVMGNLQQQLSDKNPNALKWKKRIQIALDAAHGLDYLHNRCKPPIVHRDLKSSNILLNQDLHAKIADFGLSRAFAEDIDTHVSTRPAGTLGYLDPEFHSSGNLNKKSDVYSFGIILLELVTGQPAIKGTPPGNMIHVLSWVIPKLERGDINSIVDPRLQGKFNPASACKFVEIAISCTPPTAIQRPDIAHIVSELKDCLALEIATERKESNMRRSSYSQEMCILQLESETGPRAR